MDTKLAEQLCTQYELKGTGNLRPLNGAKFILQIRDSKYVGFPQYLQLRATGQPRPLFLSSVYEPRTPDGLWNIEIQRKRYEARRTSSGYIEIYPLVKRSSTPFTGAPTAITGALTVSPTETTTTLPNEMCLE
jgi:hypothetical protein